jgi:conjugal transfer pilus assembly protein TraK
MTIKTWLPRRWLPMAALALISPSGYALQIIDARDGVTAEASIAIKEPTRIRIEGAAIKDVFGNIYSSDCALMPQGALPGAAAPAVNPGGEVVVQCDRDKGEIYVRPVGGAGKPINLFISSADATYTLLLRRVDTPADTIVLRDRTGRSANGEAGNGRGLGGPAPLHVRELKSMLVMMASDRVPSDVGVEEVGKTLHLWVGTEFTLMRRYEGRGLIGEKYLLSNTGKAPMTLAEQEFDRERANVLAVAIENHNLLPGDSTNVYVIRGGE